jgi:hypothetical protein
MDSRGHIAHIPGDRLHSHMIDFSQVPAAHLRCGDTLSIEIEVDPSFDPSTFEIEWSVPNIGGGGEQRGPKFTHKLSERDVSAHYFVTCRVISNAAWHKLGLHDDQIDILYRVLPPL